MCIYRHLLCGIVVWAVVAGSFPAWAQQGREVSVDGLIYDLAHPDGDRRKAAARLLGQHKADRAVPGQEESPVGAREEPLSSGTLSPNRASFGLRIEPTERRDVCVRKSRVLDNIPSYLKLVPIPHEVVEYIAAVAEKIHDVFVLGGVLQPQPVPQLVNTGEVHDRVSKQLVLLGQITDFRTKTRELGSYKNGSSATISHPDGTHFSITALPGRNPVQTKQSLVFRGSLKFDGTVGGLFPRRQGPLGKDVVSRSVT